MDQTGQNIIDAAMELVVERGYTATTTKDIAKRAGVNEREHYLMSTLLAFNLEIHTDP